MKIPVNPCSSLIHSWHSRGTLPVLSPPSLSPCFSLFPPCSQNDKLPGPFSAHKAHLSYRGRERAEREDVTREEGEYKKKLLVGSETSSPVDSTPRSAIYFGFFSQLHILDFLMMIISHLCIPLTLSPFHLGMVLRRL